MDLVTTSVLLDAGAGDVWKYTEKSTGFEAGRSEGLGVASFHMFGSGAFSSDPGSAPHRADSAGLKGLADDSVRTAFQVDDDANPLVGCEGRTQVCWLVGCLRCFRVLPCLVLVVLWSCRFLSCHVLSCPVLSFTVLSCPVLSCLVESNCTSSCVSTCRCV